MLTSTLIVCRYSLIKSDDIRLKRDLNSARWCWFCDLAEEENGRHCILLCPAFEASRDQMFKCIKNIDTKVKESVASAHSDFCVSFEEVI